MNALITGAFQTDNTVNECLLKLFDSIYFFENEQDNIEFSDLPLEKIDVIVCNNLLSFNSPRLFQNLKFVQFTSAGLDRVPINELNDLDIKFCNAKDIYAVPISEWVVLEILLWLKQRLKIYENQKVAKWNKIRNLSELNSKRVTILGYGNIGKAIAQKIKPFGVKIVAVDIVTASDDNLEKLYSPDDLLTAVEKSDVVISCLPYSESTEKLIDKAVFNQMSEQGFFINVSRGKIVNEADLVSHLLSHDNFYTSLDVFEIEPLESDSVFWQLPNVQISPHNSFISDGNSERLLNLLKRNLDKLIAGETLCN